MTSLIAAPNRPTNTKPANPTQHPAAGKRLATRPSVNKNRRPLPTHPAPTAPRRRARVIVNPCRSRVPARTTIGVAPDEFLPLATGRDQLPDPRPVALRFARAILDVMVGQRGVQQLTGAVTGELYEQLVASMRQRPPATNKPRREVPQVMRIHLCEPDDGVAEATAVVRDGAQVFAVALRFEGLDGAWRCSFFSIV